MRSKRFGLVALAVAAVAAPAVAQGQPIEVISAETAPGGHADAEAAPMLTAEIREQLRVASALAEIEPAPGGGYASAATVQCESGGDYSIDTGNGYYGGYQFLQSTWDAWAPDAYVGVKPSEVPPKVQDAVAASIPSDQWPNCP
jgi:hypothetical protein